MNPMLDDKLASTGAVPIRCFGGKDLQPDEPAWRQLHEMAALRGAREHVTVLPDVHYKSRNPAPSGTVLVTRDAIFPRAIDDGMNCGMRSMATDMDARAFTPEVIDALFERIKETVPLKRHEEPLLSEGDRGLLYGPREMVGPLAAGGRGPAHRERGRFDLGLDPARSAPPCRRASPSTRPIGYWAPATTSSELRRSSR
jgi:hypothetical protein